jgi:hypothetical protein
MKSSSAMPAVETRRSVPCAFTRIRALLARVQARHRAPSPDPLAAPEEPAAPSLHDLHVAELEASCSVIETPMRHDDPAELRRARRVFAMSWLVPLLLVSGTLVLFGARLDHALVSLLQFSQLVLAVPLTGSLLAFVLRSPGRRQ